MVLRLIGHYDSPFVRRVGVSLHVLGIPFERDLLSVRVGSGNALSDLASPAPAGSPEGLPLRITPTIPHPAAPRQGQGACGGPGTAGAARAEAAAGRRGPRPVGPAGGDERRRRDYRVATRGAGTGGGSGANPSAARSRRTAWGSVTAPTIRRGPAQRGHSGRQSRQLTGRRLIGSGFR